MMGRRAERSFALFVVQVLFLSLFAGCLEALDTTVDPRATLDAYPTLIQEGDMVALDARDSSPVEGVITGYSWDFGDGTTAETVIGFTSHTTSHTGNTPSESPLPTIRAVRTTPSPPSW